MPETITKVVSVRVETKKAGDIGAPFKQIEQGAKAASKSVKDMAPTVKTTTDVLRKMLSDTKDQTAATTVKIDRLSKSIVELGLKTKDVQRMAAAMGKQWQLTGEQINQALAKAGQGPMGGGAGFWTKERGGGLMNLGGSLGAGYAAVQGAMEATSNFRNIRRGWSSDRYVQPKGDGMLWGMAEQFHDTFLANEHTGEWGRGATDRELRLRGQETERQGNRDFQARSLAIREARKAEEFGVRRPFVDAERAARLDIGSTRDEVSGLRGLGATRNRIEADRRNYGIGLNTVGFMKAQSVFDRPGGRELMRGLDEQAGSIAKGQAGAEAAAAKDVVAARAQSVRLAREEEQLRQQLAANQKRAQDEERTQGRVISAVYAERANIEQQLSQVTAQRRQAEQGILGAIQNQNQTRLQGMQEWKQFAAQQETSYRNIGIAERERIQSAKEGFGLMDPEAKRASVQAARNLAAGRDLDQDQLNLVRGQPIFQDKLREFGEKRAGPEWAEIIRLLGADRKAQEAEQAAKFFADVKLQMENKITAEIKINEQSLAQQLQDMLLPKLYEAIADAKRSMNTAIRSMEIQRDGNRRALTGSP